MPDEQPPLFDHPAPPKPKPRMAAKPAAPKYARYRLTRRTLCDDCVKLIHLLGVAIAPYPRTVRWRRTHDGGVALLCDAHKEERMARDA